MTLRSAVQARVGPLHLVETRVARIPRGLRKDVVHHVRPKNLKSTEAHHCTSVRVFFQIGVFR